MQDLSWRSDENYQEEIEKEKIFKKLQKVNLDS